MACAIALAACATDARPGTVVERDSAGVRIIVSSGPAWRDGDRWVVDTASVLDLTATGTGDAHEFFRVADATRLPDGGIAVAHPAEIRFFSASGDHLETVGREGEGPGEYERLTRLEVLRPDSLAAYDYWQRRTTIYGPDRRPARVVTFDIDYLRRRSFTIADSGFVVMESWPSVLVRDAPFGLVRTPLPVVLIGFDGEGRDIITSAAGTESVRIRTERGIADALPFFGRDSHLAVHRDRLVLGDAIELGYRVIDLASRAERIVRAPVDLSLDPGRIEAERSARLGADPSAARRRALEELPVPGLRPAYAGLIVDATGAVWLEEHRGEIVNRTSAAPKSWEVFSESGVWLGQVFLPGRFTVFEIGPDYVLGLRRDELDIEHVESLPLRR